MALTPVIIGTPNDVVWGANGVYGSGRVVSADADFGKESDPSLDNNGVETGEVFIPRRKTYRFEMEMQTSTNLPNVGDVNVNICGDAACIIDSVKPRWQRKGRKLASIEAHSLPS